MISSEFNHDLQLLVDRLHCHKPFALARFGDGEYGVFRERHTDFLHGLQAEYEYHPSDSSHAHVRQLLLSALTYRHPDYLVGIVSPCCQRPFLEAHRWMKEISRQPESNLTWATIFSNANYDLLPSLLFPELTHHRVFLVANEHADTTHLSFPVETTFRVGVNAWIKDLHLSEDIRTFIGRKQIEGAVFLFCAGPLAKILVRDCQKDFPNNTYIDLGSALDEQFFGLRPTRSYHFTNIRLHHCEWL